MSTYLHRRVHSAVRPRFARNVALGICQVAVIAPLLSVAQPTFAEDIQFNGAFLPEDSRTLDLSQYQQGNPVLPGQYRADVAVNGRLVNRQDIRIDAAADGSHPTVCFSRGMLELIGVDRLDEEGRAERLGYREADRGFQCDVFTFQSATGHQHSADRPAA